MRSLIVASMRSLVVAFATLAAFPALAQAPPAPAPYPSPAYVPPSFAVPYRSSIYLAITGGGLFPEDVTASGSGTIGGTAVTGSGRFKLQDTYIGSAILGLQLTPLVSFEIEGGYTHLERKSGSTGTLVTTGGTTTTGVPISGSGNAYLGFGNLLIWPLGADALVAPYLGGGGGVAAFKGSAVIGDAATGQITVSTSGRQTTAAAAAIAGLDFGGPGPFRIGARYKYLWFGLGNSRNFKQIQAQAVTAVLSARF